MENAILVTQEAGTIKCDFESAKAYLNQRLDEYRGIIFTEDSKAAAKKTVAELRAEKKAFDDRVKEVKAEFMAPFMKFNEQAMELLALYDEPIDFINKQIDDFETKRREEKRKLIRSIYKEYIDGLEEYLPYAKIYNPKWENATYNQKSVRGDIYELVHSTKEAIKTITEMKSEVVEKALEIYKGNLSLTDAIAYINRYEQQKADILRREQERKQQEEIERIRREEREKILAEQRAKEEKEEALRKAEEEKIQAVEAAKKEASQEVIDSLIPGMEGESDLYEYRLSLTPDAKEKLEIYLDSVGIEWEMI